ncbi:MAG: sigma-70 family RNA polymerase sigma factor [Peptostreptococcaceae bacterium]
MKETYDKLIEGDVDAIDDLIHSLQADSTQEKVTNEELVKRYQEGDKYAIDELIEQNKKLIEFFIHKYSFIKFSSQFDGVYVSKDDLIQESYIGLMIAAEKFDAEKGCKFSTYASHYIYSKIMRYIKKHFITNEISLDTPVNDETDTIKKDTLEDDFDYSIIDDNLNNLTDGDGLYKALETYLTTREKDFIYLYYGLNGGKPSTQKEIAELFELSTSRVEQIFFNSYKKLRRSSWGEKLYIEMKFLNLVERKANKYDSISKFEYDKAVSLNDLKLKEKLSGFNKIDKLFE